uniref:Uncharacterized protein n=1 Tax=Anguilla anguilla TaxID=7936 RepID=A0A0E9RN72_ANGAN
MGMVKVEGLNCMFSSLRVLMFLQTQYYCLTFFSGLSRMTPQPSPLP